MRGVVDCSQQVAPEDPGVKAQVAAYRAPVDRFCQRSDRAGQDVFDGNREPGLRTQEMPLGNLIADVLRAAASKSDQAVAAIFNSGSIRASINAGRCDL